MTKEQEFIKMLRDNILPKQVIIIGTAIVTEVGETTCSVKLVKNDIEIKDVLLTATGSNDKGILIFPKLETDVVVGAIGNDENSLMLLKVNEIEKIIIKMTGLDLQADENGVIINGGDNGGLVISSNVNDVINDIKSDLNQLKTIMLTTWVPVIGDGGTALKGIIATWAGSSLAPGVSTELENNNVKH